MRIHIATIGHEAHHAVARASFLDLAATDAVARHEAEADPVAAEAILFVDLQQHPDDPLLRRLRRHPLVHEYPEKVFVYDERDFPTYTFPGVYVGAPEGWARRLPVRGGPYPSLLNPVPQTRRDPDLLFSFRGARSHPVRDPLLRLAHARALVEESASAFEDGDPVARTAAFERYEELVSRSKFVLCPRGHGPSTFRLYEALGAGRVPVVISDDWLPPPRVDWSGCILRISEGDIDRIPQLLEAREADWPSLVAGGEPARAEFSQSRLWNHYAESIASLVDAPRSTAQTWWALPRSLRMRLRVLRASSSIVGSRQSRRK